jgi:hypothetical protein
MSGPYSYESLKNEITRAVTPEQLKNVQDKANMAYAMRAINGSQHVQLSKRIDAGLAALKKKVSVATPKTTPKPTSVVSTIKGKATAIKDQVTGSTGSSAAYARYSREIAKARTIKECNLLTIRVANDQALRGLTAEHAAALKRMITQKRLSLRK